jgi:four helix bundle protein
LVYTRRGACLLRGIRFNKLALRGARESEVWLHGCQTAGWGDQQSCRRLLDEADQLIRILVTIVKNTKRGKD